MRSGPAGGRGIAGCQAVKKGDTMLTIRLLFVFLCLLIMPISGSADEMAPEKLLPSQSCAPGWNIDGKVLLYDRDTLFERINGESELYFPYGFELLASARYENSKNSQIAVDADVYKMGSPLDAFGMYANYRRKDDAEISIGTEGTVSPSQLFFYQDRYLVRLQATGTTNLAQDVFLSCAREITRRLPENTKRPGELAVLMIPAVVPKSERYIAQSLLGYDFFRRGLITDARLQDEEMQVFVVLEDSPGAAAGALDRYRGYLAASGQDVPIKKTPHGVFLQAVDPLYGQVLLEQSSRHLIGVIKFKNKFAAQQLLDQLKKRTPR